MPLNSRSSNQRLDPKFKSDTSEDWLQKAFQLTFRLSPNAYRQSLRVNRAIELLKEGGHTVLAIALEVGYQNERALQRAFLAQAKAPPQTFQVK